MLVFFLQSPEFITQAVGGVAVFCLLVHFVRLVIHFVCSWECRKGSGLGSINLSGGLNLNQVPKFTYPTYLVLVSFFFFFFYCGGGLYKPIWLKPTYTYSLMQIAHPQSIPSHTL